MINGQPHGDELAYVEGASEKVDAATGFLLSVIALVILLSAIPVNVLLWRLAL